MINFKRLVHLFEVPFFGNLKQIKLIVFVSLVMLGTTLYSQDKNVHFRDLQQADSRIYVSLHHNRTIAFGAQFYGVKIQNKTNDILRVHLQFYCNLVCGERLNQKIGFGNGIEIKPGTTIGAEGFFDTDNTSFDAGNRRSPECLKSSNKSKKIGEKEYTAINNVGYQLLKIENVSEQKRLEEQKKEAEAKRKKEEQERLKIEKEAAAKKKKEEEERIRLEAEAIEKKKKEEEEKARIEKELAEKRKKEQEEALASNKAGKSQNSSNSNSSSYQSGTSSSSSASKPSLSPTEIAYQKRNAEIERQRNIQIQRNQALKEQQRIAQLEADRKRKQQIIDMQARIAENNRKSEALNNATQETMNNWSRGNYIQGSEALATEFAKQGNTDAAITTVAVGTGLQIFNMISEDKKRKEEADARKAEYERQEAEKRRQRAAIEAEQNRILQQQKREFNILAEENRKIKKDIILKRKHFLENTTDLAPTYDLFSEDESPIYIFYVQANNDYDKYYENINFPDEINIKINENAQIHFSPLLTIYPNYSGEYPYLKEILAEVENNYLDSEKGKYKIYNWSRSLEEIQDFFDKEVNLAVKSHFSVVFSDEPIADFIKKDKKLNDENVIDYWNPTVKKTLKEDNVENTEEKKSEVIDYWDTPKK